MKIYRVGYNSFYKEQEVQTYLGYYKEKNVNIN